MKKRKIRWAMVTVCLMLLVLSLILLSLTKGTTDYSMVTVFQVLLGNEVKGATFAIGTIRLPRVLTGALVGMAFGMAGNTFQTILRNPLASPDVIGITTGTSAAAVFCILVLNLSQSQTSLFATLSGLLIALCIYTLARGGSFSGGKLIIIGIGMQAMLNAVISYLLLKASQNDVQGTLRWLSGSLNGVQMKHVPRVFFTVLIFGTVLVLLRKHLQILEIGEDFSVTLGVRTNLVRSVLIVSAVILVAVSTSVTGPIAFVAFLAGPIAAKLAGTGNSNVLPAGFTGAVLVLLADFIGQNAFTTRYPVGVITGIIGAPYLIFIMIQMNRKGNNT